MGTVNSQPKSTDSAASPLRQDDDGIRISVPAAGPANASDAGPPAAPPAGHADALGAVAGHMTAGLSVSAGDDGGGAVAGHMTAVLSVSAGDDGGGAVAGRMTSGLSVSAGDDGGRAEASNRGGDEVQNTSPAENRSGEEAKDTSGPRASEKKIRFPIPRGQRDCFSFVQTGNCKFGSKCWYNHPQQTANNLDMHGENDIEASSHKIGKMKYKDMHGEKDIEASSKKSGKMKYKDMHEEKDIEASSKKIGKMKYKNMQRENEREASTSKTGKKNFKKDINKKEKEILPEKLEYNENKDIRQENDRESSSQTSGKMRYKNMQRKNERAFPQKTGTMKCKYYLQGRCSFGKDCRLVHYDEQSDVSSFELNFLGLPLRPGEIDCFSYMETGSCKFATRCKYNHPDPIAVDGQDHQSDGSSQLHVPESLPLSSPNEGTPFYSASLPYVPGVILPAQGPYTNSQWNGYQASAYPYFPNLSSGPPTMPLNDTPRYSPNMCSTEPTLPMDDIPRSVDVPVHFETPSDGYRERPRQKLCRHFMKNGDCKLKSACKFHHPKSRLSSTSANANSNANIDA